jgi:DNA repair protein RadC
MIEKLDAGLLASIRNKQRQNGTGALKDEELIGLIIKRGDDTKDVLTLSKICCAGTALCAKSAACLPKNWSAKTRADRDKSAGAQGAFELGIRTLDPQAKDMKIRRPKTRPT